MSSHPPDPIHQLAMLGLGLLAMPVLGVAVWVATTRRVVFPEWLPGQALLWVALALGIVGTLPLMRVRASLPAPLPRSGDRYKLATSVAIVGTMAWAALLKTLLFCAILVTGERHVEVATMQLDPAGHGCFGKLVGGPLEGSVPPYLCIEGQTLFERNRHQRVELAGPRSVFGWYIAEFKMLGPQRPGDVP